MSEVAKMQPEALPADPMVSMIERVAMNPDVPIERLERMLDMKERMDERAREDEARQAKADFFIALAEAQAQIPVVLRNRYNQQTKSNWADLAAIEEQAMPIIRDQGFSVSAWSIPGAPDGMQRVCFRVARGGHVDEVQDDFPLDAAGFKGTANKTAIQGKASTVSYARRYLLCGYFNLATADNDGRSVAPTISEARYNDLRKLIEEARADEARLLKAYGINNLSDLPANKFDHAVTQLRRKIADNA